MYLGGSARTNTLNQVDFWEGQSTGVIRAGESSIPKRIDTHASATDFVASRSTSYPIGDAYGNTCLQRQKTNKMKLGLAWKWGPSRASESLASSKMDQVPDPDTRDDRWESERAAECNIQAWWIDYFRHMGGGRSRHGHLLFLLFPYGLHPWGLWFPCTGAALEPIPCALPRWKSLRVPGCGRAGP